MKKMEGVNSRKGRGHSQNRDGLVEVPKEFSVRSDTSENSNFPPDKEEESEISEDYEYDNLQREQIPEKSSGTDTICRAPHVQEGLKNFKIRIPLKSQLNARGKAKLLIQFSQNRHPTPLKF